MKLRLGTCNVFCNEATMNLRLIEQACDCVSVRGGNEFKVRARLCLQHSSGVCLAPLQGTCKQMCSVTKLPRISD